MYHPIEGRTTASSIAVHRNRRFKYCKGKMCLEALALEYSLFARAVDNAYLLGKMMECHDIERQIVKVNNVFTKVSM